MNINEALDYLSELIEDNDWFHDVGMCPSDKLIVYTKWQSREILEEIPNKIAGYQILVHFAPLGSTKPNVKVFDIEDEQEYDLNDLTKELDRLEKICGTNILGSIFYEIQDQNNAVTNLSAMFPEVRLSMDKLFEEYGFDIIFENLEL